MFELNRERRTRNEPGPARDESRNPLAGFRFWAAPLLGCLLFIATDASAAQAHDGPPGDSAGAASTQASLKLVVTVIHAKKADAPTPLPDALKPLEKYLFSSFNGYRDFALLSRHDLTVGGGRAPSLPLPNGTGLSLRHDGVRDGYHHLHLEVGGLKTTVHVEPGATFFQAGRAYEGGIIVLAFQVAR